MTLRTNARVAGIAYLLYIGVAFPDMVLSNRAAAGADPAARLATMGQHAGTLAVAALLGLASTFCAIALAASLRGLTRSVDEDLAFAGALCRLGEGVAGLISVALSVGLTWLATSGVHDATIASSAPALAAFVFKVKNGLYDVGSTSFAAGSTLFCWLFLRGLLIPLGLAWVGLVASVVILVGIPLQMAGVLPRPATMILLLPMLAFEVPVGFWLLFKPLRATLPKR